MMFTPLALQRFRNDPDGFFATFKHQWLISRDRPLELPGWHEHECDGWYLRHASDLPAMKLLGRNNERLGYLLGVAVDAAGRPLKGTIRLPLSPDDTDFADGFQRFVEGCAGRYIVALLTPRYKRLFLDPVGDLAAVYDAEAGRAGSTNFIVQGRDFIDNPVIPYAMARDGRANYTMGHTRDRQVRRLLASHYLDLDRMEPVRHWPRPETDLTTRHDTDAVLAINDEITARLRDIFSAMLHSERVILPLSGGRDSRCLLGAGMPAIDQAEWLFTWRFHRQSGQDSECAKKICGVLGLPHREFLYQKLTRPLKLQYLQRNGYAIFGTALESLAISESLPGGNVMVRGNIMGILRATNWQRQREGVLNLPHALKRLRSGFSAAEQMEKFGPAYMDYYDSLPENAQRKIYDIAWTDISLTHGQGARSYGTPQNFIVNAFNDRRLLALAMQLPLAYRRSDAAYDRIIETTLPQLQGIPYV
ncbi:hypothetical protein CYR75_03510 [Paracoccus jeotgali]|uniref:Asparagine synthetase domain-containing protein n=2 Tax=Paracoccus jeotgali TaxID=2065379 RepID=A0A2K9MCW8_9RHOB|nr:hypothetical protein CYR75_03510 [Paracoccus jeotgali]